MEPFYMYVSIGALVLLIIILIVIGVMMTQLKTVTPFPATQNACPDYWDVSSNPQYCGVPISGTKNIGQIQIKPAAGSSQLQIDDGSGVNIGMCTGSGFGCANSTLLKNASAVGSPNNLTDKYQYVQLNNNKSGWSALFPGVSERCAQKQWASTLNITWDGVTNYNGC